MSAFLVVSAGAVSFATAHPSRVFETLLAWQGMEAASREEPRSVLSPVLTTLEHQARDLEQNSRALTEFHSSQVAPLIRALDTRMAVDRSRLSDIAVALIREGRATSIDPRLLLAVLLVENPWLDPEARSPVGAVGLMQVMPFHAGQWGCLGDDLTDPDHNICHAARILADALQRSGGDLDRALLRYNGCVRGTNTPDCHSYPQWVYGRAGQHWTAEIVERRGRLASGDLSAAAPEAPM